MLETVCAEMYKIMYYIWNVHIYEYVYTIYDAASACLPNDVDLRDSKVIPSTTIMMRHTLDGKRTHRTRVQVCINI